VLGPRKAEAAVAAEKLRVRQRDHFKASHTAYLLTRFLAKLTHPALGVCLLDPAAPFAAGPASRGLEWRTADPDGVGVSEPKLMEWAEGMAKAKPK